MAAFGPFVVPDISPDPGQGIGSCQPIDPAQAMTLGVSPEGRHDCPAFPCQSHIKAAPRDIAGLHAFLMTLPGGATPSQPPEIRVPFGIRRLVKDRAVPGGLAAAIAAYLGTVPPSG